jgi:hypothetical protein
MVLIGVGLFLIGRPDNAGKPASSSSPTVAASAYPPVDASPVPRTPAADKLCPGFLAALPQKLGGGDRRRVNAQRAYFLAWGSPPVIVQCGVPRPKGFTVGASTIGIAADPKKPGAQIQWFEADTSTNGVWTAVDRDVYVQVSVPDGGDATGTLQDVGAAITKTLPVRPIRPAAR